MHTTVDELEQDNEALHFALGQSEALRNRQLRPNGVDVADDLRRRRGDEMRKALLLSSDDAGDDDYDVMEKVKGMGVVRTMIRRFNTLIDRRMPFIHDIKVIQARFGSSVSAYFSFYYWLIISYYWLGMVCTAAMSYHIIQLLVYRHQQLPDIFRLYGILPYFMIFSSFTTDEALLYAGLTLIFAIILLITALSKWTREDIIAKTLDVNEADMKVRMWWWWWW